ncbi:MAG: hypothetical protein AB7Q45_12935 [Planctomycetaceae bacterium]
MQDRLEGADLATAAAEQLADVWRAAGMEPPAEYPVSIADAVRLAQQSGYRCDPDYLAHLIDIGRLNVPKENGAYAWSAVQLVMLGIELEARRRWTLDDRHTHNMTAAELLQRQAEAEGRNAFADFDEFDNEALILLLQGMNDEKMRHLFGLCLLTRLREAGVL